jgi:membrane protein
LGHAVGGTSIYGPLAAPIAVLLWLYLISIAILIGAALNAAFDRVWPESATASARLELVRRLRRAARLERLRGAGTAEELEQLSMQADNEDDDWDFDDEADDTDRKPGAARRRRT